MQFPEPVAQCGPGLLRGLDQHEQLTVAPRAPVPVVDAGHPGDHLRAGGKLLIDQLAADLRGVNDLGKGRMHFKQLGHVAIIGQYGAGGIQAGSPYNPAVEPDRGCLNLLLPVLALVSILLLGPSCSGTEGFVDPRVLAAGEISGSYASSSPVGVLGVLQLDLARFEQSRLYSAVVSGEDVNEFGSAEGIGTLADGHLALHFDRGLDYDYYFEGEIAVANGGYTISGEFIFPDQADRLPVTFVPAD